MNSLARFSLRLLSAGTVCTGGYFACKHYIFSSGTNANQTQINKTWKALDTSNTNYQEGTVGKIYGEHLLDPADESNEGKWNQLYQKITDDENAFNNNQNAQSRLIADNDFQSLSVLSAFAKLDGSTSSLNKKCKEHYEKQIENKDGTDNSKIQIGGDKWKALWMLCSEWDPKMLDLNSYQDNSIGKTRGDELLSAENKDNEKLWEKKNKRFFELSVAPAENTFKQFYEANKGKENSTKLKEKCKEIYSVVPADNQENNPSAEEVVKYCSMKIIGN